MQSKNKGLFKISEKALSTAVGFSTMEETLGGMVKHQITGILLGLGIFSSIGCAELTVKTPLPQVESPEVTGSTGSFGFHAGWVETHEVEVTSNAGARPPDLTNPRATVEGDFLAGLDVGLGSRFQLGATAYVTSLGFIGKAQYQLLGEPLQAAKQGSFSMSVFGRGGYSRGKNSGDQEESFGPGGYNWKGEVKNTLYGYGASVGYRITDQFLLFAGYAADHYSLEAEIIQEAHSSGTSPGGVYTQKLKGHTQVMGIGFQWGRAVSLRIGLDFVDPDWDEIPAEDFGPELRTHGQINIWL